ncbi:MAG: LysR substrate-binding domain-containing protein [Nocardioides sp.]
MPPPPAPLPFRVGFVTGVTPDKWARAWREQRPEPLELVPLEEDGAEAAVRAGDVDMALVRLPVDRDGLHLVTLYREVPVVVVAHEHVVSAYDEVALGDLADEQFVLGPPAGFEPDAAQLDFPPMDVADAVEVAASGTGVVVLPMSVARLHHRKDVVHRPVRGVPETEVALTWLIEQDDERTQAFVAVTRGRTARSSRG